MKHVTPYIENGVRKAYITISLTPVHDTLRKHYSGVTYICPNNAITHFCDGLPLEKPLEYVGVIR